MHPDDAKAGGNNLKLGWQLLGHFGHIEPKLPTPLVSDGTGGPKPEKSEFGFQMRDVVKFLPTIKARDSIAEGYEAGLRRQSPQMGTIIKGIVDGDKRVMLPTPVVNDMGAGKTPEQWDEWCAKTKLKHNNGIGHGASLNIEALRLLPTPNTMEHREIETPEQIAELKKRSPGGYRNLRESVVNDLMPTPTARDFRDGQAAHERDGVVQTDTVARAIFNSGEIKMLPTPQVDDSKNTGHNQDRRPTLASEVWETERETDWGKFAPAIERWEAAIDREAPAPTKPDGKDGQHRLSAEFTEWMMGLPAGWVTDPELGLTRNEQLKLCGNGVVPQQAALALTRLLTGIDFGGKNESDLVMPTLTTNGTGRHSAGYDSLGTLQMLEVAKGILPKEYDSWEQVNGKIPAEWRDGKATEQEEQK